MRSTHQRTPLPSCPTHPTQSTTIIKGAHSTRRLKAQICCWTNRSGVFVISALVHWLTAFEYVDQAVNILSEIWRPQDVPDAFKAPSKGSPLGSALGHAMPLSAHQSLPSMALSSHTSQPQTSIATMMAHQHSSFTSPSPQALASVADNLLPMKTFVHKVLKRSRASGSILQAALCYLEAIREKVPEILQQEKMGIRAHYQPETEILPATEAELAHEAELAALEDVQVFVVDSVEQLVSDDLKTVRVTDGENDHFDSMQHILEEDRASISSLVAEPSTPVDKSSGPSRSQNLPSPLLCPQRAFLAPLILASKFFQDKCYSNRAWAKLSGLPPREIGERALGQALEWRLWVGKSSLQAVSSPPTRTLCRSQSENVLSSSSQALPVLACIPVRKCATMSADSFAEATLPNLAPSSCNVAGPQDQIMPESENTVVSSIVRHLTVMLMPLLSQYRFCLRLPVSNHPSSLNRSPRHLVWALRPLRTLLRRRITRATGQSNCLHLKTGCSQACSLHGQISRRLRRSMHATRTATASRVLFWELHAC